MANKRHIAYNILVGRNGYFLIYINVFYFVGEFHISFVDRASKPSHTTSIKAPFRMNFRPWSDLPRRYRKGSMAKY